MQKGYEIMKYVLQIIFTLILFINTLLAQELISDTHFQNGFSVLAPTYPPEVQGTIGFDSTRTPIWTCGQWGSKSSLIDIPPTVMPNGWYNWENSEKRIYIGPVGGEDYDILFGVNSYNEYDGVYRQLGESWPHLLVEQRLSPPDNAGPGSPSMNAVTNLAFHVEAKLENDSTIIEIGYDANIHAAQFLIYFTVQNLNPNSPGYGAQYIWLGVQIFDDRNERPAEYINHDDGTQTLIYSIAYDSVATKSVHSNEWISFDVDLYPYALKGLEEAWLRGYLSASQDLADYKLGGMNMGWELPGMNIGEMKIRNLSLIASNNSTDVNTNGMDELSFQLFQNYPNPFNPNTIIKYSISQDNSGSQEQMVILKVYDLLGREISTLLNEEQKSGTYEVQFDATNFTSGVYYYQITVGGISQTKKLIILK
jgi:hypothetical protein